MTPSTLPAHARRLLALAAVAAVACPALAQSVLREPTPAERARIRAARVAQLDSGPSAAPVLPPQPLPAPETVTREAAEEGTPPETVASLQMYSITSVIPPPPKQYQKHDQIEIIINESSVQKLEQSLETTKEYDLNAGITELPNFRSLLDAQLRPGNRSPLATAGANSENEFSGEGTAERSDRFTARISARVLDIKPNGTLVLEARKDFDFNGETSTLLVSGLARPQDITAQNTVQSAQLADLAIRVENTGELRKASKKGVIPRVLDTIFNF